MLERFTPARLASRAQKEGRELLGIAHDLPYQIHDVLQEIRDGQIEVGFVHKGLDEFMHKLDVAINRVVVALVVAGGLLGSSFIGIFATDGPQIFGVHFLSVIGFLLSGLLGAWLLIGVLPLRPALDASLLSRRGRARRLRRRAGGRSDDGRRRARSEEAAQIVEGTNLYGEALRSPDVTRVARTGTAVQRLRGQRR